MAWYGYSQWRPYVPVAKRRAQTAQEMSRLRKKGANIQPVLIRGRKIAQTFWGEAWCDHLEKFSDYANRLPRGRTYVRNGSVCHLAIAKGRIEAKVSGSSLYTVTIDIKTLPPNKWKSLKADCAGQVGSLLELLQGKLSDRVMAIVTDRNDGLFPSPNEISLDCSCPDWATMCKHVAAVLYGVGSRLDSQPELLFALRGVNHQELVSTEAAKAVVAKGSRSKGRTLDEANLTDVFGIDVAPSEPVKAARTARKPRAKVEADSKPAARKSTTKKSLVKKAPTKKVSAKKSTQASIAAAERSRVKSSSKSEKTSKPVRATRASRKK
jgi:uncharacterized Zn finger protein